MREPQQAHPTKAATAGSARRPTNVIVQIKVKLLGVSKPPVWRRLHLHADTRLDRVHETIVAAFGWDGYHMHVFTGGLGEYGEPDPELGHTDERRVSIGQLIDGIGDRFRYTYDFGDDWEHEIVVEDMVDADPGIHYPVLVAAKGACPPEDCGGPWGYANLKDILTDPSHEQHQETLDWLGLGDSSEFDPTTVATDQIKRELALSGAGR